MESFLLGGHFPLLFAYKRRIVLTIYNGNLVVYRFKLALLVVMTFFMNVNLQYYSVVG
jgi:hypothetical protein